MEKCVSMPRVKPAAANRGDRRDEIRTEFTDMRESIVYFRRAHYFFARGLHAGARRPISGSNAAAK